MALPL